MKVAVVLCVLTVAVLSSYGQGNLYKLSFYYNSYGNFLLELSQDLGLIIERISQFRRNFKLEHYGWCAFSVAAPELWNNLSEDVKSRIQTLFTRLNVNSKPCFLNVLLTFLTFTCNWPHSFTLNFDSSRIKEKRRLRNFIIIFVVVIVVGNLRLKSFINWYN